MSVLYLNYYLAPSYVALPQEELRLSPGDGLKGMNSRPVWL
jgi:hypothetical protein